MNWGAATQAYSCAHSYIFISNSVAGCCPGLLQNRQDFLSWDMSYQLCSLTMQTQLPRSDIVSIFNMHLTPSFLSVKSSLLLPASLSSALSQWSIISLPHRGSGENGCDGGGLVRKCITQLLWLQDGRHKLLPTSSLRGQLPGVSSRFQDVPALKWFQFTFSSAAKLPHHAVKNSQQNFYLSSQAANSPVTFFFFFQRRGEIFPLVNRQKCISRRIPSWTLFNSWKVLIFFVQSSMCTHGWQLITFHYLVLKIYIKMQLK